MVEPRLGEREGKTPKGMKEEEEEEEGKERDEDQQETRAGV